MISGGAAMVGFLITLSVGAFLGYKIRCDNESRLGRQITERRLSENDIRRLQHLQLWDTPEKILARIPLGKNNWGTNPTPPRPGTKG